MIHFQKQISHNFFRTNFWILPFISFLIGYYLTSRFFSTNQTEVPSLIGKNLNDAAKILSDNNLNLRILSEKEDSDLLDNTIIDQNPIRQKIKINKPVYLTISRKFKEFKMPNLLSKDIAEIKQLLQKLKLKYKTYFIENDAKENSCISQIPDAEKLIDKNEKIIIYISSGNKKPVLIPDFKNIELTEVINFLSLYEIKPTIIITNFQKYDSNKKYKIIDQRPIAGSILTLNKNLNIQLQVEEL